VDFASAKLVVFLLLFYVIYWVIRRLLLFKLTETRATIGAVLLLILGFFSHQLILGPLLYYSKLTSGDFTGTLITEPKSVYLEDHTLGHLSFIPIYRYLDGVHISRLALPNPDGSITIFEASPNMMSSFDGWRSENVSSETTSWKGLFNGYYNKWSSEVLAKIKEGAHTVNSISELAEFDYHVSVRPLPREYLGRYYYADRMTIENMKTGKVHTVSSRYWSCRPGWQGLLPWDTRHALKVGPGPYELLDQILFNFQGKLVGPSTDKFKNLNIAHYVNKPFHCYYK
jgi:hypothetical protein